MHKPIAIGTRFGRLVVSGLQVGRRIPCKCDCGIEKTITRCNLITNTTHSCGCLHKEVLRKRLGRHFSGTTPVYKIWSGMKARCRNSQDPSFDRYGGRGITVCERWNIFENFRDDMGPRPAGTGVDRIDNDGNYEPSNCRWATAKTQNRNKRTNVRIEMNGETRTLVEWCEVLNLNYSMVVRRRCLGWSMEDVMRP